MKCISCGSIINDNDNVCPKCGTSNDNLSSNGGNTKKKKKKFIIFIILFIVFVLIGSLYLFVFNKKTSKDILIDGFKEATNKLFIQKDLKKQSFYGDLKVNLNSNESSLASYTEYLNNINFIVNEKIDTISNIFDCEFILKYNGQNTLGIGMYSRDKNIYLKLLGLYGKYIRLPISDEQYNTIFRIDENSKIIKDALDNAFISSIDDKYIKKSTKKIKINGDNTKVTVHKLALDKNNYKKFIAAFIKNLSTDKKFINLISEISQIDSSTFSDRINNINYDELNIEGSLELTILTSGILPKFKGIEFNILNADEKISISYYKINEKTSELLINYNDIKMKYIIKSKGINANKKTTFNVDSKSYKMKAVLNTRLSKIIKFENIDVNNSINLDDFIKNGYKDIDIYSNELISIIIDNVTTNNMEYEFDD